MDKTYLVTGGAGFIGSNFILSCSGNQDIRIVNLDRLTYAANPVNLAALEGTPNYVFIQGDIADRALVSSILASHKPCAVINLAAESHVDRSIDGPAAFIETNVVGTFHLLEEVHNYWRRLPHDRKEAFRFLHVSTDEVYGSLGPDDPPFHERTPYAPNSPYSASKAASDHLVRSYHHTYGLPTLTTNCSNNYGPRQFPEKLIPLIILNAVAGKSLPVYGDGRNIRDWLYVEDHCEALHLVLDQGQVGDAYNIGGYCEKTNLDIVRAVCSFLDVIRPQSANCGHYGLVTFVKDRPGHDRRYAIDCSKITADLGWRPKEDLDAGLRKTITWYLENPEWVRSVQTGAYREWIKRHYGDTTKGDPTERNRLSPPFGNRGLTYE